MAHIVSGPMERLTHQGTQDRCPPANRHWETKTLKAAAHKELNLGNNHTEVDPSPVKFQNGSSPVVVQLLSHVRIFATPRIAAHQASCPSPTLGACSDSSPLSRWCHPTISSSVISFSSCLQSFPASGSFLTSWLFTSVGQSIGASALASVLPMNIRDWFPLGLSGLISLQSKGLSRVFSNTTVEKHQFFGTQPSLWSSSTTIHDYWKNIPLTIQTFVSKVMSLLFNTQSRFVIAFLPRSKCLLISWLYSPSTVILEPKKIKSVTISIASPSMCHEVMPWSRCHDLSFLNVEF